MKFDRILLIVAGILGIAAFFFPFISLLKVGFLDVNISGLNLFEAGLQGLKIGDFKMGGKIFQFLSDLWVGNEDLIDWGGFVGLLFVLLGPVYFLAFSISYLIKGLKVTGRYRRGLSFLIIYSIIAFAGIYFSGQYYHIKLNFFNRAGLGYWLSAAAILLAWLSRFLKPKDVTTSKQQTNAI